MTEMKHKTMQSLLEYAIRNHGPIPALMTDRECISYTQLYQRVMGLAATFQKKGMQHQKIDLIPKLSLNWVIVYCALLTAGATVVLHEPEFPIQSHMQDMFLFAHADELASWDRGDPATVHPAAEEEIATIIYTSGTTGRQKGVMLSQKNLISDVLLAQYKIGRGALSPGDRTIPILPLFHMFGITASILAPIYVGMTLYILDDPKYLIKMLPVVKPRILFVVPMIAKTMASRSALLLKKGVSPGELKEKLFGGVEMIVCGGAKLQPDLIDTYAAFGIQLLNGYGITECSPVVTTSSYNDAVKGSVGKVHDLPNCEVRIIDNTIHVHGDIVMEGYYGREASPFKLIDGQRWFDTKDMGYIDKDGSLYITGRQSNLIILDDGNNISPEEIEILFASFPSVQDVMIYEDKEGSIPVVAASLYPSAELRETQSEAELQGLMEQVVAQVNRQLPSYKQIKKFSVRKTDFQRTSLNKIIRKGVNTQ